MDIYKILRAAWNSPTYSTLGMFFISSVKGIALYPVVLTSGNENEIALWLLWLSIINLSHMFELGFIHSFSKQFSYAMGGVQSIVAYKKEIDFVDIQKSKVNWKFIEKLYSIMGIIFLTLSIISIIILSTIGTYSVSRIILLNDSTDLFWLTWIYIILSIGIMIYGRKYRAALHGMNYIPLINQWNMMLSVMGVILAIISYYIFKSIISIMLVTQTFVILSVICERILLKQIVEGKKFSNFKSFKWYSDYFWPLFSPSWRSAISIICSFGMIEISGVIYSQFANIKNLNSYLLALRVINIVSAISRAPFYSKLPLFARLRAQNKINELINISKKSVTISLYTFSAGIILTSIFIDKMLILMGSQTTFIPVTLWFLMGNVWYMERHHGMHAQLYSTINHEPFYIPIFITAVLNISIIILFYKQLDFWVFPIAQGISNMIINNWWNVKISIRSLDTNLSTFLKSSFLFPLVILLVAQFIIILNQ